MPSPQTTLKAWLKYHSKSLLKISNCILVLMVLKIKMFYNLSSNLLISTFPSLQLHETSILNSIGTKNVNLSKTARKKTTETVSNKHSSREEFKLCSKAIRTRPVSQSLKRNWRLPDMRFSVSKLDSFFLILTCPLYSSTFQILATLP